MTKLLSGIGPPRTTVFADVSAAVTNDVAVVTSVAFDDPDAVWMFLDHSGTPRWEAISHEDHNGLDSPADLGQSSTFHTSTVVKIDGDYYQRDHQGTWAPITPFEVDEQPGPTVGDEAPGTLYSDRRADSALWRYDDGEWAKEAEGLGTLLVTDPQSGDTLAYDDPPGHWINVPATVILEFDGGTVTNAAEFLDDLQVDGAFNVGGAEFPPVHETGSLDGTFAAQGGGDVTNSGDIEGVTGSTDENWIRWGAIGVYLTFVDGDNPTAGTEGSPIQLDLASMIQELDSLSSGYYVLNGFGSHATFEANIASSGDDGAVLGVVDADGNLRGYDGSWVTDPVAAGDWIRFRLNGFFSND